MSDIILLVIKKLGSSITLENHSPETNIYSQTLSPILESFLFITNFSDIVGLPVSINMSTLSLCLSWDLLMSS